MASSKSSSYAFGHARALSEARLHQRSASGSHRIDIPTTPSSGPLSASAATVSSGLSSIERDNARTRFNGRARQVSAQESGMTRSNSARLLTGRKRWRRRWLILLVLLLPLGYYLVVVRSEARQRSARRRPRLANVSSDMPRVDRSIFDRLKALEEMMMAGSTDDDVDPDLARYDRPGRTAQSADAGFLPVDAIPDPKAHKAQLDENGEEVSGLISADLLDRQVCPDRGDLGCSFLVPAWLGEQETKAQGHLYQLGLLALSLNRTLVLPNVDRSRMGVCFARPFSFYYAGEALNALGIPTISQAAFMTWASTREPAPTGQVVSVEGNKAGYPAGAIEIDATSDPTMVPGKPTRRLCLAQPKAPVDFTPYSPLSVVAPLDWHRQESTRLGFGESIVNTLRGSEIDVKSSRTDNEESDEAPPPPDVLAFNWELRFPVLTADSLLEIAGPAIYGLDLVRPFEHFDYASVWIAIGDYIASQLSPFIGIHWRQETLDVKNLYGCAESLIETLKEMAEADPSLETVYLATDYPIEDLETGRSGSMDHSSTFHNVLRQEHHDAMKMFLTEFEDHKVGSLRLTTFSREAKRLSFPEDIMRSLNAATNAPSTVTEAQRRAQARLDRRPQTALDLGDIDPGLLGIIDKAVVMKAEVFMAGEPDKSQGCGKISSFTRQIIASRGELLSRQSSSQAEGSEEHRLPGMLWNDVTTWRLA
ncbi:uncharacterized protein L969DRAFT_70343 [Mixia osmundae IAM 14324]|uniref:Uncharacterized protein n=1 Tax=Mixia osmundae (strain CBS 9802 / IAM 14324 / JCM 22182 / KY 12970) TaxID=764103 RepID=G7DTD0_MIXOS|nr:uncharacterized protein L969DRAFT_70343 [Mixia osmundae IAM 14324]KEI42886.1 hypothetical protein L969DRAFT_70343 [Mixia osmundae IAM 14324]GAA93777.1 hypothetical protein E5Q_00423 [Mixia osmundae IAM 14324]